MLAGSCCLFGMRVVLTDCQTSLSGAGRSLGLGDRGTEYNASPIDLQTTGQMSQGTQGCWLVGGHVGSREVEAPNFTDGGSGDLIHSNLRPL